MPDDMIAPAAAPKSRVLALVLFVSVAAAIGGAGGGAAIVYSGMMAPHAAGEVTEVKAKVTPPTIVELPRPFTANLRESGRYVQLSLGIAVSGGATAADELRANDVALRSTVIETLSNQTDIELADPAGKKRLRQQLTKALNDTVHKSGAEYKVVDVFFTAFVVQ